MNENLSLRVLVPSIPGQRWSCHTCGECCRRLAGHLFAHECTRLDEQGWAETLGVAPYVRVGRQAVLNKRSDGACVFLTEDNRCRIHADLGESAKPLACRIFPFSLRPTSDGWQASLRFDCPSVISSRGEPLRRHGAFLRQIGDELLRQGITPEAPTQLVRGLHATRPEIEAVTGTLVRLLTDDGLSCTHRLMVAARLTAMLDAARLRKVRGTRFAELVDLLSQGLAADCETAPSPPTRRQAGLMRQFAFACSQHVTLETFRGGFLERAAARPRQLADARRFMRAEGDMPTLPDIAGPVSFAAAEHVRAADSDGDRVQELVVRYATARIEGGTVFGDGYYGWPMFRGLAALWLSLAAIGWLARCRAAAGGRDVVAFDDVGKAMGTVDAAATRAPALGTFAERSRVAYLLHNDGLARLLAAYSPVYDA